MSIDLDDITVNNKHCLRVINEASLPTRYPDSFYDDALSGFSQFAYFGEVAVGAVKAKLQTPPNSTVPSDVYIESVAVLEPYRGRGIGKKLVQFVVDQAKKSYVHEVTLHVWAKEDKTKEWYEKIGFTQKEVIPGYYKEQKLDEPDAVLMSMKF